MTKTAVKYRVKLDFLPEDFKEINRLKNHLKISTRAELFQQAIIGLRWMSEKRDEGKTIGAVASDKSFVAPEFEWMKSERPAEDGKADNPSPQPS